MNVKQSSCRNNVKLPNTDSQHLKLLFHVISWRKLATIVQIKYTKVCTKCTNPFQVVTTLRHDTRHTSNVCSCTALGLGHNGKHIKFKFQYCEMANKWFCSIHTVTLHWALTCFNFRSFTKNCNTFYGLQVVQEVAVNCILRCTFWGSSQRTLWPEYLLHEFSSQTLIGPAEQWLKRGTILPKRREHPQRL